LLEHLGEHRLRVDVERDAVELAQLHQVSAHEDAQLLPLTLARLAVAHRPLVLHAHPQLVHLREVAQHKRDGILDAPAGAFVLRAHVRQLRLCHLREVVAEEEASHRVLHATAHLDQVL